MSALNDLPFEVQINRSKRKTVAIYVRNGKADVRAPLRAPKYWIEEFVIERQSWIQQQISEQSDRAAEHYSLESGSIITFMGKPYRIVDLIIDSKNIYIVNDAIMLPRKNRSACFHQWLKQQASDYMQTIAYQRAAQIGMQEKLTSIRFRKTKTSWGHCTTAGIVQFNWLIMLMPEWIIDYLISHEVCHLQHMNHSPRYWALVESICPRRKEARQWLRAHEHKVLSLS